MSLELDYEKLSHEVKTLFSCPFDFVVHACFVALVERNYYYKLYREIMTPYMRRFL